MDITIQMFIFSLHAHFTSASLPHSARLCSQSADIRFFFFLVPSCGVTVPDPGILLFVRTGKMLMWKVVG